MTLALEDLGMSQEEMQERVIESCARMVLRGVAFDEDGEPYEIDSTFHRRIMESVQKKIDAVIAQVSDEIVGPAVRDKIDSLVIQRTNSYGEKKGEPVTFVEYLMTKADTYLNETVDISGKPSNYSGSATRLQQMIGSRIHAEIAEAMKVFVSDTNKAFVKELAATAKRTLIEISNKLNVEVKTK